MKYNPLLFWEDGEIDGTSYIADSGSNPNVFKLNHNDDGLWLNSNWANPDNHWNLDNEIVFRFRK
jgi:hypothetical protein